MSGPHPIIEHSLQTIDLGASQPPKSHKPVHYNLLHLQSFLLFFLPSIHPFTHPLILLVLFRWRTLIHRCFINVYVGVQKRLSELKVFSFSKGCVGPALKVLQTLVLLPLKCKPPLKYLVFKVIPKIPSTYFQLVFQKLIIVNSFNIDSIRSCSKWMYVQKKHKSTG